MITTQDYPAEKLKHFEIDQKQARYQFRTNRFLILG